MHIALLNDDALPVSQGGTAVVVDRLSRGYKRAGHSVTLITTHQDASQGRIVRGDGRISIFSNYPLKLRHRHCLGDSAMRAALTEVFSQLRPDAVHANNIHAHLTYESLIIAKKHTSKIILTAHDVFLVAFARVRGERFEHCTLQGKPYRMHGIEHLLSVGRKYWPLRNSVIRTILAQSQAKVVAISDAHRRFLTVNGINVAAVVSNGTEVLPPVSAKQIETFRSRLRLTGPTILFGGRLSDDKGSTVLLEAFARVRSVCPDAQLLIAGEAERITEQLSHVSDRTGIVLAGWLPPDDMRVAYSAATLTTTPSLCFDPFNLMNIESMAEGTPVVATCFGGAPEIIEDGKTGLIVNPRDTQAFSDALLTLINHPEKAREMGEQGRQRVQEMFSVDRQCAAYIDLLS